MDGWHGSCGWRHQGFLDCHLTHGDSRLTIWEGTQIYHLYRSVGCNGEYELFAIQELPVDKVTTRLIHFKQKCTPCYEAGSSLINYTWRLDALEDQMQIQDRQSLEGSWQGSERVRSCM